LIIGQAFVCSYALMTQTLPKIALGTDHAGYAYKEYLKAQLQASGYGVEDFGTHSAEPVDYPLFVKPAARAVSEGKCDLGIVLGGSGNGEAIAANKVPGIRCALCWDETTGRLAKEHNNANVLSLGERQITKELAWKIVQAWLNADFEGGRHQRRIDQLETA
jgi:ribose 5-phosphate isomerase B